MYKLYLITNLINYKRYAGITSRSVKARFTQHCTQGCALTNAILKYGKGNFKVELISKSDNLEVIKKYEVKYIKSLRLTNREFGYNISEGGDLTTKSEYVRNQISKKLKGKPKSDAHKRKIKANAVKRGKLLKGKKRPKFSEEWKANIRKGSKGKVLSDAHKQAISKALRSSEKFLMADKGSYFRTNNPQYDENLKFKIASSKFKPIYCVNNKISYLSLKFAAQDLGLKPSSLSNALFRGNKLHGYKFYYIYK